MSEAVELLQAALEGEETTDEALTETPADLLEKPARKRPRK